MKLSALQFSPSASVVFNEHHKCHYISVGTDKTPLFYSLQLPPLSGKIVNETVWDPKVGFRIPYGPYTTSLMLTCTAVVNSQRLTSVYIPKRQSESFVFFVHFASLLIQKKKKEDLFLCVFL